MDITDGARLWEIEPFYQETSGKSLKEVSQLFDSVYVSFYKGLGGITGAMLTSNDAEFLSSAKTWQRRAGGNSFTLMYELIDCERGYNENIGSFDTKKLKMTDVVAQITAATQEKYKNADGQSIVSFVPTTPTCCQIHTHLHGYTAEQFLAARDRVQHRTGIRVFERLRLKQTVDEMMEAKRKVPRGGQGKDETLVKNEQPILVGEVSHETSCPLSVDEGHADLEAIGILGVGPLEDRIAKLDALYATLTCAAGRRREILDYGESTPCRRMDDHE